MYRGKYFNRSSVNICGDYLDGDIYPVFQPAGKRRKRCNPTKEIQQKLNQRNAEKKLTRLAHKNFTENDLALHLTYRDGEQPETIEEAERILDNYIRCLRRRYKKAGLNLKYIRATERGAKNGRIHHHLIISGGLDRDLLEETWGRGYANSKRLQFDEKGITGLTHYVAKERATFKRWSGSRNLVKPDPEVKDNAFNMGDVEKIIELIESKNIWGYFEALYPGYELIDADYTKNDVNRGYYIHFEMRKIKPRRR